MMLKIGVYMDGHKRLDVVDYQVKSFLPLMAQYEQRMVHWVANKSRLAHINPELGLDKKRIIAVF